MGLGELQITELSRDIKRSHLDEPIQAPSQHVVKVGRLVCQIVAFVVSNEFTRQDEKSSPFPKSVAPQQSDIIVKDCRIIE
jgi:hypothetical protein